MRRRSSLERLSVAVYILFVHSLYETLFGSPSETNHCHCCRDFTASHPATNSGMPLRYHNMGISWSLDITVGENDADTALQMIQLRVIIIQHLRALESIPTRCVLGGRWRHLGRESVCTSRVGRGYFGGWE